MLILNFHPLLWLSIILERVKAWWPCKCMLTTYQRFYSALHVKRKWRVNSSNENLIYRDLCSLLTKFILCCQDKGHLCCCGQELLALLSVFYSLNFIPTELQNSLVKINQWSFLYRISIPRGPWENVQHSIERTPKCKTVWVSTVSCIKQSIIHVLFLMDNYETK